MSTHAGELAALVTAVSWAVTALLFEAAGRRIGSLPLNLIRLLLAFGYFTLYGLVWRGLALPLDAGPRVWLYLSLSGLVGFTFGDLFLFRAFVLIGARLASLVMSLVPPLVLLLGMVVLDERLEPHQLLGMTVTVVGVAWVVSERRRDEDRAAFRQRLGGFLLALGGALGQAGGLVLSKLGMGSYDPFAATHVRVIAGGLGFVVLFTVLGAFSRLRPALADRPALGLAAAGAFFGPFLGVGLSLYAVQHTLAGVAATVMALTPVLLVPLAWAVHGERVSTRALVGTLIAFAGVAVLFV